MKKILSFVLVLAMIASMMCVSVSATNDFVGANDTNDGKAYGEATGNTGAVDVTVYLGADVINRYAVDLLYNVSTITFDGTAEWNVQTLEYDNDLTFDTDYTDAATDMEDVERFQVADFTVTNYSDLGIQVTLETSVDANTGIVCEINTADVDENGEFSNIADAANTTYTQQIAGAYDAGGSGTNAKQVQGYTVDLYAADWARAFTQMMDYCEHNNDGSFTVATVTFKVAPLAADAPTQNNG